MSTLSFPRSSSGRTRQRFHTFLGIPCLLVALACDDAGEQATQSTGGPAGEAPALDLVIDDFEDGDGVTALDGVWYDYTDKTNGGGSTIEVPRDTSGEFSMEGEGFESERSLLVEFSFDQGELTYEPYVGFGSSTLVEGEPLDLSQYSTLQYTYRGAAHAVRLETLDVTDYDFHVVSVPAATSWTTIELGLALFTQEGWGMSVPFDPTKIVALSFHVRGTDGGSGQLELDNLGAVKSEQPREPDMVVRDPAPPARISIESVEVTHPLQEVAMEWLNRGYNITNWLEQGRFDGFDDYNEDFVKALASAGFEGVRLPIDLDLYVEEVTGSGDSLELTLHDDLFLILDSFEQWTLDAGLSFTIDFHQYDRSLDFSDAASKDLAVALWGRVAEHFSDNTREDLFFELLNEPELSAGGDAPTQTAWSDLAQRMIDAIREHDSQRTLIFGDVEWYGIGPLTSREPFSDDNIIYAFHFYEPFVFTHQGASWSNMGSTHDIPFPYDPERWSEYSSDLGFTPFMESWILSQASNYYRTGNADALFNRIAEAKKWSVEHNVPVICNEFGVYDATSQLDDRARYYSALIGIFDELQIPWQHWFMIMDDEGEVLPEYREAFGLGE